MFIYVFTETFKDDLFVLYFTRTKKLKRKRRSSRVMSALEPLVTNQSPKLPVPAPEEPLPPVTPKVEEEEEKVKEESEDPLPVVASVSAPPTACIDTQQPDLEAEAFIYNKKKKVCYSCILYQPSNIEQL